MSKDLYIVDDNPDHHFLLYKIIKQFPKPYSVRFFEDGKTLHNHLVSLAHQAANRLPALIVLDLNMPGMNGLQLLKLLKQPLPDPIAVLKNIPVIMMSSDVRQDKIAHCYQAGANAFITKPIDFETMKNTLQAICEFWLEANYVPYLKD